MQGELIFQSEEIRKLFSIEKLMGENFDPKQYEEIIKNETLKSVFCNPSLNESVDAFLAGNLNLTCASAKSYVHRNTLLYRIGKIKKLIGLDLKIFNDCVIYLNARNVFYMLNACDF